MKFEFNYENMTIEEMESYMFFNLICDGDSKKIIAEEAK